MSIGTLEMYYGADPRCSSIPSKLGMVRLIPQQTHTMQNITPMKGMYSLVIDNSGSVGAAATMVNNDGDKVDNGWSQLDIAKHSTNTFVNSLDSQDYVTLTIYNSIATNLVGWTRCDEAGKILISSFIDRIHPECATNMVAGLNMGLSMFNNPPDDSESYNKTIVFTTDGIPSAHFNPARGIPGYRILVENFLRSYKGYINIFTIGLGSALDSVLLTEICCDTGEFLHLPDPGAVGPFMVNLVAQCRTVACLPETQKPANNVYLRLSNVKNVPGYERILETHEEDFMVPLKNVMIDTPRDVVFEREFMDHPVTAGIYIKDFHGRFIMINADIANNVTHDSMDVSLQWYRQSIMKVFAQNFGVDAWSTLLITPLENISNDMSNTMDIIGYNEEFDAIWKTLNNEVLLGVTTMDNFNLWGRHYMRSLLGNLRRGVRTNFRDFILQKYSRDARGKPGYFDVECEKSEAIFASIPAPTPSRTSSYTNGIQIIPSYSAVLPDEYMRGGGCFAPECTVDRWNGSEFETITLSHVRPHDELRSRQGKAEVKCVVKTICPGGMAEVVKLGELRLTAWHPVWSGNKWVFPATLGKRVVETCNYVYNFVLYTDHILVVSGREAVTLGHGIKYGIARHPYWGVGVIDVLSKKLGWLSGYIILETPLKPPRNIKRKAVGRRSIGSLNKLIHKIGIKPS